MALSTATKDRIYRECMREASVRLEPFSNFSKAELRTAIDTTETWMTSNMASFNSSLPPNVASGLNKKQKIRLFKKVLLAIEEEDS